MANRKREHTKSIDVWGKVWRHSKFENVASGTLGDFERCSHLEVKIQWHGPRQATDLFFKVESRIHKRLPILASSRERLLETARSQM